MPTTEQKYRRRRWSSWATGLVIILMGLAYLLHNLGVVSPFINYENWWALFVLAAAIWPLAEAYDSYRDSGRFDGRVQHSLLSAAGIVLVAAFFLLHLDWGVWWPLFMILGGLWVFVSDHKRDKDAADKPKS